MPGRVRPDKPTISKEQESSKHPRPSSVSWKSLMEGYTAQAASATAAQMLSTFGTVTKNIFSSCLKPAARTGKHIGHMATRALRENGFVGGYQVVSTHSTWEGGASGMGYTGGLSDAMKDVEVVEFPDSLDPMVHCLQKAVKRFPGIVCDDPEELLIKTPVSVRIACPMEDRAICGAISGVSKLVIVETMLSHTTLANISAKCDNIIGTQKAMLSYVLGQVKAMVVEDEKNGAIKFTTAKSKVMYHWSVVCYWCATLIERMVAEPVHIVEHHYGESALTEPLLSPSWATSSPIRI